MHQTPHVATMFWYDTWLFNLPELAANKGIKLFPTIVGNKCLSVLITLYAGIHHSVNTACFAAFPQETKPQQHLCR